MKLAVCNELFGSMRFGRSLDLARRRGFTGVEIAPFTLFGDFSSPAISDGRIVKEARSAISGSGVDFVGLHWLFVRPEGLWLTSPDEKVRGRAVDHLRRLLDISGELGGGVLVLGSPKQRASRGTGKEAATKRLEAALAEVAFFAADRGSSILVEALPRDQETDVVNTLAEASAVIAAVAHPAVGRMFDFHNTADEAAGWPDLIASHAPFVHVHLNEMDGRNPKPGSPRTDAFREAFGALRETGYQTWVSLEIFFVPEDPDRVLAETAEFMGDME